jgi:DNA-binding CsgD family transcriptional regulator
MTGLAEKDLRELTDTLGELYVPCTLDEFSDRVLAIMPRLIGFDVCSYNEIDPGNARIIARMEPFTQFPDMFTAFEANMDQHPLIRHFNATGDERARKISDFVSTRDFRQLPIYQEFFRHVGVDHQLGVAFHARDPVIVGVAVNRLGTDFSERDRAALDFLRPHLARTYASAAATTALGLDVRSLSALAQHDAEGAVVLTANDVLSYVSDRARELLARYFGAAMTSGRLPAPMDVWIASVRAGSLGRPVPALLGTRQFRRDSARLTVAVISADAHGSLILALTEQDDPAARAAMLGLTQREAEVLSLVAAGQTNSEIAESLGISPLTVRTHLEHAFPKLGVRNRTEAAAKLR